jgi:endonuclease YncB( thermonuclease family)
MPKSSLHIRLLVVSVFILVFCTYAGCIEPSQEESQQKPADKPEAPTVTGLPLETEYYQIEKVIDGDTFRFENVKHPVRLLCVDTEEVFKEGESGKKSQAVANWQNYLKENESEGIPSKYPTPFGEEAEIFAENLLKDADSVCIEYDSKDRQTCFFHRPLCYIFINKGNQRINLNCEIVKAGFSPYYTKYGYSLKYHDQFIEAENTAKNKKIGIWDEKGMHYPDYAVRLSNWKIRADQIQNFQTEFSNDSYFLIQDETDFNKLKDMIDQEITVFGTIDSIRKTGPPWKTFMEHKQGQSIMLITDDNRIYDILLSAYNDEEFIYCHGKLEKDSKGYLITLDQIPMKEITRDENELTVKP